MKWDALTGDHGRMCGRYAAIGTTADLVAEYDIDQVEHEAPAPSHNIAPTASVPAVVQRGDVRKLVRLKWGLVPSWAKDPRGAARLINARSETVASKPSFRAAFAARRCLLPALGYYEWTSEQDAAGRRIKQPWFISPDTGAPLTMAGLYEFWRDPDGDWLATCTVITTTATDRLGVIHDRMPMSIAPQNREAWLDPDLRDPEAARALMGVDEDLRGYRVSRAVNNVRNDGPDLIEPLDRE